MAEREIKAPAPDDKGNLKGIPGMGNELDRLLSKMTQQEKLELLKVLEMIISK